jgi:hypothetical protein
MRHVGVLVALLCLLGATGCAGMKLGAGYNFDAKQFFLNIEKPLEPSLKK